MNKIFFFISFFTILLLNNSSFGLSSSSYLIANSAMMFSDYQKAKSYYDTSNLDYFSNYDLGKKLLAFVNVNDIISANEVAKKILEIDENNQEAWLVYLVYAKINNDTNAFKKYQKQKNDGTLEIIDFIFYNRSNTLKDKIDISKSIFEIVNNSNIDEHISFQNYDYFLFYLSLSLLMNNKYDEAYFYSAQIYQILENYELARANYEQINENHILFLEGKKNIALNKQKQKEITEAENDFLTLIDTYPDNESLLMSFADFYRTSNQYKKAIRFYSTLLNKYNVNEEFKWRILYLRGICYERINNWDLAEKDFLNSLKINKNSPQVLNYLAYGWIEKNKNIKKSLEMLEKAYKEDPESYYILDSLAWAHFKMNNLILASELMEEVLVLAPGEAISIDHLGDIYFAMGRTREAFYMWKQAKDLAEPEDDIIDDIVYKLEKYKDG
tara:strand:- start:247 stop:1572 length:1326 start_codon:yes stop_codon:yes gene_type:complete